MNVRVLDDAAAVAAEAAGVVAGEQTARAELVRDRQSPRRATLTLTVGADEPIRHEVLLSDLDDAAVLSILLSSGRRDPVYLRSLRAAAELLSTSK